MEKDHEKDNHSIPDNINKQNKNINNNGKSGNKPKVKNRVLIPPMKISKQFLYGFLILIVLVILGSLSGYWKGINDRVNYQEVLISTEASDQLVRAMMDMDFGNYSQAVTRLEYIISIDPSFPGATDLLAESLRILDNPTPTPTTTPTPTITPTPTQDLSSVEGLFQHALTLSQAEDWDNLLTVLDQLRYENINYNTGDVNTLYFNALRNRGVNKILVEGHLEAGIFDLNNAENFFPLDIQATNFRQWAEWYLTGASFWGVDWYQVIAYFEYIVPHAPNLMDSSYFFAKDRLATAEVVYPTEAVQRAYDFYEEDLYCEADGIFQYLSENYGPLSVEFTAPSQISFSRCQDLIGTATASP